MTLQQRTKKLEERLELTVCGTMWDLRLLTDDELLALDGCFADDGQVIAERVTSELTEALARVKR